jgi:hypothetical protein
MPFAEFNKAEVIDWCPFIPWGVILGKLKRAGGTWYLVFFQARRQENDSDWAQTLIDRHQNEGQL